MSMITYSVTMSILPRLQRHGCEYRITVTIHQLLQVDSNISYYIEFSQDIGSVWVWWHVWHSTRSGGCRNESATGAYEINVWVNCESERWVLTIRWKCHYMCFGWIITSHLTFVLLVWHSRSVFVTRWRATYTLEWTVSFCSCHNLCHSGPQGALLQL